MLDLHCSSCHQHVLVGTRAIEAWSEDAAGIRLDVRCPCGALNVVRAGRGAASAPPRTPRQLPTPPRRAPRARAA